MNKRIKLVLLTSLLVNVIFAGVFLGHMSHRFLWSHTPHHFSTELLAQLPYEKRVLFEDTMRASWQSMENTRSQMDAAKADAIRLLKVEPFNEGDFLTQMQHVNDLHVQMKRHMSEAAASIAKQFTPDERAVLAEIIFRPPGASGERHENGKTTEK